MARSNVDLAIVYIKDFIQNSPTYSKNNSHTPPLPLKERCTNLAKASGLLARAPLLCLPLVNRVTQLALRFLSRKLSIDYIFPREESAVRYSKEELLIRNTKIEEQNKRTECKKYIQKNRSKKQKITLANLENFGLSKKEIQEICQEEISANGSFRKANSLNKLLRNR
jgi:hypothetical protein